MRREVSYTVLAKQRLTRPHFWSTQRLTRPHFWSRATTERVASVAAGAHGARYTVGQVWDKGARRRERPSFCVARDVELATDVELGRDVIRIYDTRTL